MAAIQADLDNIQESEGIRNEASFRASIKNATSLNKCSGHTGVPSRDGRLFLGTIVAGMSTCTWSVCIEAKQLPTID